jgi:hypothetical protein
MYFLRQGGCFSLFWSIPGRPLTIWKGLRRAKQIGLSLVPDVDVQDDHSYAKRNVLGGDGLSEFMGKAIGGKA